MEEIAHLTIASIINDAGGVSNVAAAIGKGYSTVSEMKRSRSIPVKYWPVLIDEAARLGNSLDEKRLMQAHLKDRDDTHLSQDGTRIARAV